MKITNIQQAKSDLSNLIDAVLAGEEVIITEAGKPLVKLVAYSPDSEERKPGLWKGKVFMSDDFDTLPSEVLDSFLGLSE